MGTVAPELLAGLLQQSGVGWLLSEDRDDRLRQIGIEVGEVSLEIARRLGLREFDLFEEMRADTAALKLLIRLFTTPTSREMRAMVYCVLRGMEIKAVDFSYRLKDNVSLEVTLDNNGDELCFKSDLVWDTEILRHIAIMTTGQKPILHGFYAFR